ncbi:hypothetical protein V6347_18435 [Acinetobacter baumannii]|uniref:hypothetical protein n=1 Tax=Acinetobacter baumannii TaxID=470 RepID=UPI002148F7FA|nr:hypothetical protein [Acinetobacter baumannii]MCR0006639.1 hypothetical protein [Acinetobacter baumannii]MDC4801561.1 hypothetical protein [Acinetobacter baumannii]MDC5139118.1 hypothetical protein [Acinetobacter baumannii]MDC5539599.1 hypothetical protein [Acinetobacter baumannii]MDH2626400.1 hypothetical protein [Acinetobacter baumannii]
MKREEVRKVFSEYEPRAFWRNSYSESATDGYDEIGINIYYDSADKTIALEFYEPAQVAFNGIEIFNISVSEVYKLMASLDKDIAIDGDGLTLFKFGIGFYEPNYEEEPFLPVEAIIIFIEGYYD